MERSRSRFGASAIGEGTPAREPGSPCRKGDALHHTGDGSKGGRTAPSVAPGSGGSVFGNLAFHPSEDRPHPPESQRGDHLLDPHVHVEVVRDI